MAKRPRRNHGTAFKAKVDLPCELVYTSWSCIIQSKPLVPSPGAASSTLRSGWDGPRTVPRVPLGVSTILGEDHLTYIRVEENHIDFGLTFPTAKEEGHNFVTIERGTHLSDAEFGELKEFVFQLPDPDMVVVV